ncbi:MAG: uridine kinase [Osedax symbiont Rs1]|nr:MAG: uridine kinase [Osedax symbiont Rs1]
MTKNTIIIGIAGASASGKTLLANTLIKQVSQAGNNDIGLICEDSYYHCQDHLTMAERVEVNYDSPKSKDFDLLCDHIEALIVGDTVDIPQYDFVNHTRFSEKIEQAPKKVIIIEGILLFTHRRLRKLIDAKIYVDTALDFCFIRRLKRDVGERGRTMDSVINQYEGTVRPSFYKFIEPSKKYADVIIPGGGENQVAIDVLSTYVNKLLS